MVNNKKAKFRRPTPNQLAHQLLMNGKLFVPNLKQNIEMKAELNSIIQQNQWENEDLEKTLKSLKSNKAAGLYGIPNELLI